MGYKNALIQLMDVAQPKEQPMQDNITAKGKEIFSL